MFLTLPFHRPPHPLLPARPTTVLDLNQPDSSSPEKQSQQLQAQIVEHTYNDPPRRAPLIDDFTVLIPLLDCWPLIDPFFLLHPKQHGLSLIQEQLGPVGVPYPNVLALLEPAVLKQILIWHEDLTCEIQVDHNAFRRAGFDTTIYDLTAEGTEDSKAKLRIDVDEACAMADEAFCRGDEVPEGNAQAHSRDDLVAVFGVDGVLDSLGRRLAKVLGLNLDQVLYRALQVIST